jgi:hypothetical protein
MRSQIGRDTILASVFMLATPIALACSHCIKDILSPAEFDRRSWDSAERVFVGIVTAASSSRIDEFTLEIDYRVDVEEVLKGPAGDFDQRVYTSRSVSEWETGLEQITCGETLINVGDRLLVFSALREISVGRCSSTRVIEGQAAASPDAVRDTLARIRRWRDDL